MTHAGTIAPLSLVRQFFVAVLVGVGAIFLGLYVHEGFSVLSAVTGLLLLGMGFRALTNRLDWERFLAAQGGRYPSGTVPRLFFAAVTSLIGVVWTVIGVLSLLALAGLYEFPEQ